MSKHMRCVICGTKYKVSCVSYTQGIHLCDAHKSKVQKLISGFLKSDLADAVRKCKEQYIQKHGCVE